MKWYKSKFFWIVASVLLATLVVYFNSLFNDFTNWDDPVYVSNNPDIAAFTAENLRKIFTEPYMGMYLPFTMLSYMTDYVLMEYNPFIYHLTNLLYHIFNTLLVYFLIKKLSGGRFWVAVFSALFFGIHPMHVESVAWVSERKDVLYTFFYLLSLIQYLSYVEGIKSGRKAWKRYWPLCGSFVFATASLLSKSAAVTLPVLMVLIDFYYSREWWKPKVWWDKLPFFALSVAFGLLSMQTQSEAISDLSHFSYFHRVLLCCYSSSYYIVKLFVPSNLCTLNYFPTLDWNGYLPWDYYAAPAILLFLLALLVFWKKERKLLLFGLGFYFITIGLTLQFIPVGQAIVSDRYAYVPYIGLCFILFMLLDKLWESQHKQAMVLKKISIVFLAAVAIGFSVHSIRTNFTWKNGGVLFAKVIEKYPYHPYGYYTRGNHYFGIKKYGKALADYKSVFQLDSTFHQAELYINAAISYFEEKEYDQALKYAEISSGMDTTKVPPSLVHYVKAKAYNKKGNYDLALHEYDEVLAKDTFHFNAMLEKALVRARLGDFQTAIIDYDSILKIDSVNIEALVNRGNSKYSITDYDGALADYNKLLLLDPSQDKALNNRASIYLLRNDKESALRDFTSAMKANSKNGNAIWWRVQILIEQARYKEACADMWALKKLGDERILPYIEKYCQEE